MGRKTKADYARHYRDYQGKPEQLKKTAQRMRARYRMKKKYGAAALKGKDVDHIRPIRKGGGNGLGNLRIRAIAANRADTR